MNKELPPPYTIHAPPPNPGMYAAGVHQPPPPLQFQPVEMPTQCTESTVVITTYGPYPIDIVCPQCHTPITTAVETEPNSNTHLFALLLCLVGGWLCCLIPYCSDSCQSKKHFCPNCKAYLAEYIS